MAQVVTYVVKKGDTLASIAAAHNTTVSSLVKLNNISDPNHIVVGQTLYISGAAASTPKPATPTQATVDRFGLIANSDRGMYAGWLWDRENTDHYEYIWYYSWGVGIAAEERGTTTSKYSLFTPPDYATHVTFIVKPISKTYKTGSGDNEKEVNYWTANWSTKVTYWFSENPPKTPPQPTVEIKDYTLTASLDNLQDLNADSIEFQVWQDNSTLFASQKVPITTGHASCSFSIEPGHEYKVVARSWRGELYSDWSDYSGNQNTKPSAPSGITVCRAVSSTSIYLEWSPVANADSYDIEYTTKLEYFDSSNETTVISGITSTKYTKTGLESGSQYFFRVRAVNSAGSSAWTSPRTITIGKKPSPPTTWSSTTKVIIGETLYLYWVHNSEDGSKQVSAELELYINGSKQTITVNNPTASDEEAEEKTSSYAIDTSGYTDGFKLQWRVRTCGITGEYSDWSIQREVDVYAPPTLSLNLKDYSGSLIETLSGFPLVITGNAGPNSQTPIGYHISITADEAYETVDEIGNKKVVVKNGEVYSKFFDISTQLEISLSANDVDLENNISYTVRGIVNMDSGLTAEATANFVVGWTEAEYYPNAEIGIDKNNYTSIIRPYCEDENLVPIEDVTLSIYRREYDGSFLELVTGLENTKSTFFVDPHPALDVARYRIVAVSKSTGSISFIDVSYPVGCISIIIQWAETWSNFNVDKEGVTEDRPWAGSMLMLPYNIDMSMSNVIDVSHVEYIGRKHPVSYHGTQLGETVTIKTEIPKYDKETLYTLRRLQMWTGNVYIRDPSGCGYWATVEVSYSIDHLSVIIPITLTVTRVEGGV